ncbi:MAG: ABC transporter permease [Flammeovirgaceae bacterium]|nr:ABC transporter permease [Flammeovirgaceae bacterium]MBE61303.1 ABC transporter permease [Flammeovirgaceae bacterium]HCX23237.1 ABC transporter permease [Cytophagales bacterium]
MRTILFLVRKEFLQIFRNKGILPILFVMPIIQLMVLSFAADFEIRNVKLYWIDKDQSTSSRLLHQKLEGSAYFIVNGTSFNSKDGEEAVNRGETDMVLEIPEGFERELVRDQNTDIQLLVNAIDGTKAGLGTYYLSRIIQDYNNELRQKFASKLNLSAVSLKQIAVEYSYWFNPELNYKTFMVPGILVLLVTMIGVFISSMNIVRERELGTIEQLNVTPIKKYQFIIGKQLPLWLIGLFEFTLGLIVGKLVFNIPIEGSLPALYSFAALYIVMVLGIGFFISTMTETQQQAMFISWFFLVIFLLMSGLFTAIENMPDWAQKITLINPVRYFIEVVRLVLLKGAGFADITKQFAIVAIYALIINGLAIWNYRKVS